MTLQFALQMYFCATAKCKVTLQISLHVVFYFNAKCKVTLQFTYLTVCGMNKILPNLNCKDFTYCVNSLLTQIVKNVTL